mmetsp:Transcript_69992/g.137457  ORF Transcript_69992/g.137457 Transcript_69992/m.137457 type:complete len:130 (-) Transcript_69992:122-511(-)
MFEVIECSAPELFQEKLAICDSSKQGRPVFILFTGTKSLDTGKSWCPDCVAAEPVIIDAMKSVEGGCIVLICSVDRIPYRTPDYAYRIDPSVKLTCVPTLMKWENGKAIARLNDSQSQIKELVLDLTQA